MVKHRTLDHNIYRSLTRISKNLIIKKLATFKQVKKNLKLARFFYMSNLIWIFVKTLMSKWTFYDIFKSQFVNRPVFDNLITWIFMVAIFFNQSQNISKQLLLSELFFLSFNLYFFLSFDVFRGYRKGAPEGNGLI